MAQVDRENRANLLKKIEVLLGQIDEAIAFNLKKMCSKRAKSDSNGGNCPVLEGFLIIWPILCAKKRIGGNNLQILAA